MGVLVSIKCKLDVFYAGASDNQLILSLVDVVITLDVSKKRIIHVDGFVDILAWQEQLVYMVILLFLWKSNADVMAFFKLLLIITPRRPHIFRRLLLSRIANHRIGNQGEHFNLWFDVVDFHFVGVRVILNDGDVVYVSKSMTRKFFQRPQIALALRARAIFLVFEKIYSCLFIPNCTRNQLITYTNNKAMLIAKSPEGFHFLEDYLQQQKTIDHIRILSIGLELACNGG